MHGCVSMSAVIYLGLFAIRSAILPSDQTVERGTTNELKEVDPADAHIIALAQWATQSMKNMSDSGVYESIQLHRVLRARSQAGMFHINTVMDVELESPHVISGETVSLHEIIVMEDLKEPSTRSFGIDSFPPMNPPAIEAMWRAKVDRLRTARVSLLAHMRQSDEDLRHGERLQQVDSPSSFECASINAADIDFSNVGIDLATLSPDQIAQLPGSGAAVILDYSSPLPGPESELPPPKHRRDPKNESEETSIDFAGEQRPQ
jgi:hypothetical protein